MDAGMTISYESRGRYIGSWRRTERVTTFDICPDVDSEQLAAVLGECEWVCRADGTDENGYWAPAPYVADVIKEIEDVVVIPEPPAWFGEADLTIEIDYF